MIVRHLYPVVSFAPTAHSGTATSPAERLLELFAALGRHATVAESPISLPITWVVPGAAVCDRGDERAARIRALIDARGDAVAVLGLTGAVDQWLLREEIEKSLEWSMSNTWSSGIEDAGANVEFLICGGADGERPEVLELYKTLSFPTLLRAEHLGRPYLATASSAEAIPLLPLGGNEPLTKNELSLRIKERIKNEPARRDALVLWIECPTDVTIALALLEQVQQESSRRGMTAARLDDAGAFAPIDFSLTAPSILQPKATRLAAIAELRARRGSMIATRRVLEAAAGLPVEGTSEHAPEDLSGFAWTQRTVTATMAGRAALAEEGLYALLEGGRFAGVYPDVSDRDLFAPASALVLPVERGVARAPRKRAGAVREEVHSCVSFESDISRGARSTLLIDEEQVQALIYNEYSIVTDHPALVMTQSLVANSRGEYLLLTEGLPIDGAEVHIEGRYRDGSGLSRTVTATPALTTRWAEAFEITIGPHIFSLVCLDNEARVVPWSVSWLSDPEPRLYLGTQMKLPGGRVSTSFTLLLLPTKLEGSLAERALSGNLPHEINDEIAAGRAATRRSLLVQQEG